MRTVNALFNHKRAVIGSVASVHLKPSTEWICEKKKKKKKSIVYGTEVIEQGPDPGDLL